MNSQTVFFLFAILLISATALAAEERPPFPREATIAALRYDPERSIADQCETRANTARIVRLSLLKKQNFEDRLLTHLTVAGIVGAAREICPANLDPEPLASFIKPSETLSRADCKAASTIVRGVFRATVNDKIANEHPDLVAGYQQGGADALSPFPTACEPHEQEWAIISTDAMFMARQAAYTRTQRPCSLWRRAFFAELKKASALAKSNGRAAGLKYLQRYPMFALSGSKHYCTDAIGTAVQLSTYEVTRLEIESLTKE